MFSEVKRWSKWFTTINTLILSHKWTLHFLDWGCLKLLCTIRNSPEKLDSSWWLCSVHLAQLEMQERCKWIIIQFETLTPSFVVQGGLRWIIMGLSGGWKIKPQQILTVGDLVDWCYHPQRKMTSAGLEGGKGCNCFSREGWPDIYLHLNSICYQRLLHTYLLCLLKHGCYHLFFKALFISFWSI